MHVDLVAAYLEQAKFRVAFLKTTTIEIAAVNTAISTHKNYYKS